MSTHRIVFKDHSSMTSHKQGEGVFTFVILGLKVQVKQSFKCDKQGRWVNVGSNLRDVIYDCSLILISRFSLKLSSQMVVQDHEPKHFSWILVGEIAGSAYPTTLDHLRWIKRQKISHILSLCQVLQTSFYRAVYGLSIEHEHIGIFCLQSSS